MGDISLPESAPLITLSHCNLFPHGLLPLYIFEDRYREMLAYALEHDRILCVATRFPDGAESDDDAVFGFSTAGLVRACVRGEDGASNLILQGIQRVRFGPWVQREPFRIVNIEPVPTLDPDPERSEIQRQQLQEAVTRIEGGNAPVLEQLEAAQSPEVVADVLAYHLIADPYARQPLLEMENVSDRLDYLIKAFASV